jgi:Spy/CpxP family protein refolding chaperone
MSHNTVARPTAVQFWESPKFAGAGVLLLVFLCGAVAGAVAMNLEHKTLHPPAFWDKTAKTDYLKSVTKELDLTPEQSEQMASILKDFAMYYQTVLSDGKARIFNILNEEQRRKFEENLRKRPHS